MYNTVTVISKVLPVILLILFGNILQRKGFLKQSTVEDMFLLPPPFVIPIFMKDSKGAAKNFMLNTISISILLTLVAFLLLILMV